MRLKSYFLSFLLLPLLLGHKAEAAAGFTADWVGIIRLPNQGTYRVIIKYTQLAIGEYREAHVEFASRQKAIEVFTKLAQGAHFYLGKNEVFFAAEGKTDPY